MSVSKKQQQCVNRYISRHYEQLSIRLKLGERKKYQAAAQELGISVNQLFVTAVEEYLRAHTNKKTPSE